VEDYFNKNPELFPRRDGLRCVSGFRCPDGVAPIFISCTMAMRAFRLLEISTLIFILFTFEYLAGGRRFPPDLLLSAVNRAFFFTPL
jgi:hypothetical protein